MKNIVYTLLFIAVFAFAGCATTTKESSQRFHDEVKQRHKERREARQAQELAEMREKYKQVGAEKLAKSKARAASKSKNPYGNIVRTHTSNEYIITTYKRGNVYTVVTEKNGKVVNVSKHY